MVTLNRHALLILVFLGVSTLAMAQIDYTKFEGKKSDISFLKMYEFSHLHDYKAAYVDSLITKPIKGTHPTALLTQKYTVNFQENKVDSVSFHVKLISRLRIKVSGQMHSIISYQTSNSKENLVVDYRTVEGLWKENNESPAKEIGLLRDIMQLSDASMIFEFYNQGDNPDYPEINKLKPQVKDENGVLNIEKLAKVLKENKAALAEYLEE